MKTNTAIIILVTLIAAALAYWYFFTGTGNEQPLTAVSTENAAQTRFQALVSAIQPISFDTRIFSDARFMALVDLSTPIASEPGGRLDPFATISGVGE